MKTRFFYLLMLFAVSSAANASLINQGFVATYDVSFNNMDVGTNKRELKVSPQGNAVFTSTAIPEGLAALILKEIVTERSELKITDDKIQPVKYHFKKDKKGRIEQYRLNFDWNKHEFFSTHENKAFHLPDNAQDMLSFMLHIMVAVKQGQTRFTLPVAYKNRLRLFDVKQTGKENLVLDSGEYRTIKVEHYDKDKKERYTFWCASRLDYLPVKILKTEHDGDKVAFFLRKLVK